MSMTAAAWKLFRRTPRTRDLVLGTRGQIWNKSLDGLLTRKQIFAATKEMSTCSHRPSSSWPAFPLRFSTFSWANTLACKAKGGRGRASQELWLRKTSSLLVKTPLACRQQSPLNPNSVKIVSVLGNGKCETAFLQRWLSRAIRAAMSTSWCAGSQGYFSVCGDVCPVCSVGVPCHQFRLEFVYSFGLVTVNPAGCGGSRGSV